MHVAPWIFSIAVLICCCLFHLFLSVLSVLSVFICCICFYLLLSALPVLKLFYLFVFYLFLSVFYLCLIWFICFFMLSFCLFIFFICLFLFLTVFPVLSVFICFITIECFKWFSKYSLKWSKVDGWMDDPLNAPILRTPMVLKTASEMHVALWIS